MDGGAVVGVDGAAAGLLHYEVSPVRAGIYLICSSYCSSAVAAPTPPSAPQGLLHCCSGVFLKFSPSTPTGITAVLGGDELLPNTPQEVFPVGAQHIVPSA